MSFISAVIVNRRTENIGRPLAHLRANISAMWLVAGAFLVKVEILSTVGTFVTTLAKVRRALIGVYSIQRFSVSP